MNKEKINKILFYLYNYDNIDNLIEQRKTDIIEKTNISSVAWLRAKQCNGNTLEDQAIKIISITKAIILLLFLFFLLSIYLVSLAI